MNWGKREEMVLEIEVVRMGGRSSGNSVLGKVEVWNWIESRLMGKDFRRMKKL